MFTCFLCGFVKVGAHMVLASIQVMDLGGSVVNVHLCIPPQSRAVPLQRGVAFLKLRYLH